MARTSYIRSDDVQCVLDQYASLDFFIVPVHWNNSTRVYMSLDLYTLFWFRANKFCSYSLILWA